MRGWEERAARILRESGLRVERKRVRYATLTGGTVEESRVTGYSADGSLKVTVSKVEGEDGVRVTLTARGPASSRELARRLEGEGASVDHEEGERTHAVMRRVGEGELGRLLRRILQG